MACSLWLFVGPRCERTNAQPPQVELPDYWLDSGNPWEIRRPETQFKWVAAYTPGWLNSRDLLEPLCPAYPALYAAEASWPQPACALLPSCLPPRLPCLMPSSALPVRRVGFYGELKDGKWVPGEEVVAEAYDVPIPGYGTKTCRQAPPLRSATRVPLARHPCWVVRRRAAAGPEAYSGSQPGGAWCGS